MTAGETSQLIQGSCKLLKGNSLSRSQDKQNPIEKKDPAGHSFFKFQTFGHSLLNMLSLILGFVNLHYIQSLSRNEPLYCMHH